MFLFLLPSLIYLLTALALLVLQRWKLRRRFVWLLITFSALLVWLITLILPVQKPYQLFLGIWEPQEFFFTSPSLLVDQTAWKFATLISALVLAIGLTDALREEFNPPFSLRYWSMGYLIAAFSLLALLAGNLLTLVIFWLLLDLFELFIRMAASQNSVEAEKTVVYSSFRLGGGLIAAAVQAFYQPATWQDFAQITPTAILLLQVAAFLRLGIWPLSIDRPGDFSLSTPLRLIVTFTPISPTLLLIARSTTWWSDSQSSSLFTTLLVLFTLISAWLWLRTSQGITGRAAWISSLSGLSLLTARLGAGSTSLNFGLVLIGAGGILQLFTHRPRGLRWIGWLTALLLTALPFTPTWSFVNLLNWANSILSLPLLISQIFVLAGLLKSIPPDESSLATERLAGLVYALGLLFLISSLIWLTLPQATSEWPEWNTSLPAIAIPIVAGGLLVAQRRFVIKLPRPRRTADIKANSSRPQTGFLTFDLLFQVFWRFYMGMRRLAFWINRLLEGPAGLLWAFLLTVLLASLLSQSGFGR